MALDNANFISELSIVDPPGTDPLSQGDDQIRTIKRATQQSFPLIAAAVNITDVQMNLMAIKNEANVFTAEQTIQNADLVLNQTSDMITSIPFQLSGLDAWALSMRDAPAFNQFQIRRFDALGVTVDVPLSITWTTGEVIFDKVPLIQGAPIWVAGEIRTFIFQTAPGTNWFVADGLNGTVNLSDRILMSEGTTSAPAELNALLDATAAAGTTGATAITEAQMPSHVHQHGMTQLDSNGTVDTTQIEDQSAGQVANDPTRNFHLITEPTGGGGTHTHTSPAQGVTADGIGRDFVRPLSRVVQYHQYVP